MQTDSECNLIDYSYIYRDCLPKYLLYQYIYQYFILQVKKH